MNTQLIVYLDKLANASTREELWDALCEVDPGLAAEGMEIVAKMDELGFDEWHSGMINYMTGVSNDEAWEDKYLDLLIPTPIARMALLMEEGGPPEEVA